MEGNKSKLLSWHVTEVSVHQEVEEGLLKGMTLDLQIRMPAGVLGRALVSLTRGEAVVTERNLLLPGDMRMPAFPAVDSCKEGVDVPDSEEECRLVDARVFLPVAEQDAITDGGIACGIKICLFDDKEVCREGICLPEI